MTALVIGYGSIGMRHARLMNELGGHVGVVSSRKVDFNNVYADLLVALEAEQPEYVVIANATNKHFDTLLALVQHGYSGTVLVEKPICAWSRIIPQHFFRNIFVAYNLRFHPILLKLKTMLKGEKVLSVQAYVGQYLPDWRPMSDYRASYSAYADQGGGVLRDLSHELDYLTWLLGDWVRVSAIGGHFSTLEINSDDVFSLMLETASCPNIMLQLNYLDRLARRFVIINTSVHTIEADLIRGTIEVDRDTQLFDIDRDHTYRAMHQAIQSGDTTSLCSLDEGMQVVELIEAAELAAKNGVWVSR